MQSVEECIHFHLYNSHQLHTYSFQTTIKNTSPNHLFSYNILIYCFFPIFIPHFPFSLICLNSTSSIVLSSFLYSIILVIIHSYHSILILILYLSIIYSHSNYYLIFSPNISIHSYHVSSPPLSFSNSYSNSYINFVKNLPNSMYYSISQIYYLEQYISFHSY